MPAKPASTARSATASTSSSARSGRSHQHRAVGGGAHCGQDRRQRASTARRSRRPGVGRADVDDDEVGQGAEGCGAMGVVVCGLRQVDDLGLVGMLAPDRHRVGSVSGERGPSDAAAASAPGLLNPIRFTGARSAGSREQTRLGVAGLGLAGDRPDLGVSESQRPQSVRPRRLCRIRRLGPSVRGRSCPARPGARSGRRRRTPPVSRPSPGSVPTSRMRRDTRPWIDSGGMRNINHRNGGNVAATAPRMPRPLRLDVDGDSGCRRDGRRRCPSQPTPCPGDGWRPASTAWVVRVVGRAGPSKRPSCGGPGTRPGRLAAHGRALFALARTKHPDRRPNRAGGRHRRIHRRHRRVRGGGPSTPTGRRR